MKVVAFNGSPRKEGNTYLLVQKVFEELQKEGIETEYVHVGGKVLRGCTACYKCRETKDRRCALPDDGLNGYIEKMESAQGIILASPVYYSNVTAETAALISRAGFVSTANGRISEAKGRRRRGCRPEGGSKRRLQQSEFLFRDPGNDCSRIIVLESRDRAGQGRRSEGRRGARHHDHARSEHGLGAQETPWIGLEFLRDTVCEFVSKI